MNTHSATGDVTSYGLACGYIMRSEKGAKRVDLYQEHNTYFVKLVINGSVVFHEAFARDKLLEARTYFRKLVKAIK